MIEDILEKMEMIESEYPVMCEHETDARSTWPARWQALYKYLYLMKDEDNVDELGMRLDGN